MIDAIREARSNGIRIILATGHILGELRHAFPDVDEHFDAIVAENGASISSPHGRRLLVDPVDDILEVALLRRHVPVRAGEVLLACDASHDVVVLEEIGRLGLDCQILRNRAALMVLPAGVTKASGLIEALDDLGVSRHSTITIGDAENDRRLPNPYGRADRIHGSTRSDTERGPRREAGPSCVLAQGFTRSAGRDAERAPRRLRCVAAGDAPSSSRASTNASDRRRLRALESG